jgi:predicted permease
MDDVDEELRLHLEEAAANGRAPDEARRALGSPLRLREESRDARVNEWLDACWTDVRVAARQLSGRPVTTAAVVVSLALGIGSCLAAFRVADALFWRPLPIAHSERLYVFSLTGITPSGTVAHSYSWAYPQFARMREAVKDDARLLAASLTRPLQVSYAPSNVPERTTVQYVSAELFDAFGLRPVAGGLLTADDDRAPGASPSAVLSEGYWRTRFGADPAVVGRVFHLGEGTGRIVGVVAGPFVGTEPGVRVDVFLPASMQPNFTRDDAQWLRAFALVRPGVPRDAIGAISERARAVWRAYETQRATSFTDMPPAAIDQALNLRFELTPAPTGSSPLSVGLATPLAALGIMVVLVLLVACGNVASLAAAQAAAREREMALRASIGAGRRRLVQMVAVECAMVAAVSTAIGAAFAEWAAPFVVRRASPPDAPVYLPLPVDWHVAAAVVALSLLVAALFGVWPALRASRVSPLAAMRGVSPRFTRRPVAGVLLVAPVAFCVLVVFVGGLLMATFERLSTRTLGFSPDGVVALSVSASSPQLVDRWAAVRDALRARPGVEDAAIARWPMLDGSSWNGFVSVDGAPVGPILGQFLDVSPEFLDTMQIPLIAGRDLTAFDRSPGAAVVNETFVRTYLDGVPPGAALHRHFAKGRDAYEVVGVMRDALYEDVHEVIPPLAFVSVAGGLTDGSPRRVSSATILLRVSGTRASAAVNWRDAVRAAAPGFNATAIRTQQAIVDAQTVRERLLAMLAAFFSVVALALAGVGLYGMLHYAVLHRRQEIGIRRAIGATGAHIAVVLTRDLATTAAMGAALGLAGGVLVARSLGALFYGTRPADPAALAAPIVLVLTAAVLAGLAPLVRALRIDPLSIIRTD